MHRRRSAVFIERSAHIHAPCPPRKKERISPSFYGACSAVLTFTHLARRLLHLRRGCSHSRTLKAHHSGALLILGVPGGSACLRVPYPPTKKASLTRSFYGVPGGSACLRAPCPPRKKRTDLSVLLWRSRRESNPRPFA